MLINVEQAEIAFPDRHSHRPLFVLSTFRPLKDKNQYSFQSLSECKTADSEAENFTHPQAGEPRHQTQKPYQQFSQAPPGTFITCNYARLISPRYTDVRQSDKFSFITFATFSVLNMQIGISD